MEKNKTDFATLRALYDELGVILNCECTDNGGDSAPADSEAGELEAMSFKDLKKLCKSKGLPTSGNREELIARLSDEGEEEPEEALVKKTTKKASKKKSEPVEEEPSDEDDDSEEEDSDADNIQSQVEAATEDMSLEELAEFCEENGLSSKGKRQALISRIVKAVEAGDIELSDDDDEEEEEEPAPAPKTKKKSGGKKEEAEMTAERKAAMKSYKKDTTSQFKKGEIERDDLIEFLCDFHGTEKKTYKKMSDEEVLSAYIEASSNLIDDDGEIVEEGAYTVNGVPYCCGRPLAYNEDEGQYVCEHCGGEYEADEE